MSLKIIDLFCGAGGLSTGFEMAGFETILGIEHIERFGETFKANHPEAELICDDIRKVKIDDIKKIIGNDHISVVCGGPPCQGFSGAGRRDPSDPRNSLFMEFIRIVDGIKPDYFVMENVPGLLTMKTENGEIVTDIISSEFEKIGYKMKFKKLVAADYGVPQKRRRIIFIGSNVGKPLVYPQPTHAEKTRMTIEGNKIEKWIGTGTVLLSKEDVPPNYFHGPKMIKGFIRRKENNRKKGRGFGWQIINPEKPCYTISARYWKDGSDALVKYSDTEVRMLTEREAASIQSFPEDYEFCGNKREKYMQVGNAVPCLMAKAIAKKLIKELNKT